MSTLLRSVAEQLFLEVGHCNNQHGRCEYEL